MVLRALGPHGVWQRGGHRVFGLISHALGSRFSMTRMEDDLRAPYLAP